MGVMKEKGMEEQEKLEAWDRLDCLITKHELQGKFEDWGLQYGLTHALHNLKDALVNRGEAGVVKLIDGVIKEVLSAQESCGEGCGCGGDEGHESGVGSDAVNTPVEAAEVVQEGEIMKLGDGSKFVPLS